MSWRESKLGGLLILEKDSQNLVILDKLGVGPKRSFESFTFRFFKSVVVGIHTSQITSHYERNNSNQNLESMMNYGRQ